MPSSTVRGVRKRRRIFCLPLCLSAPSVRDSDGSESPLETSPPTRSPDAFFWHRFRRRNRTVPVEEITGDGKGGHVASASHAAPPKGNRQEELLQKLHKEQKRSKTNSKPIAEKSFSARAHNGNEDKHSSICRVLTKYNSRRQPAPSLHRVPDPVQTGISTSLLGSPNPSRYNGSAATSTQRLDSASGLLMLATTVAVTLFSGRVCAVFCTCVWLYLLPYFRRPLPPRPPGTEKVDVDSAEYKKKVVLKGLLERNRGPIASPVRTR